MRARIHRWTQSFNNYNQFDLGNSVAHERKDIHSGRRDTSENKKTRKTSTSTSNVNVAVAHKNGARHVADQKIRRKRKARSTWRLWYDFYFVARVANEIFCREIFDVSFNSCNRKALQLYSNFYNPFEHVKVVRVKTRLKYLREGNHNSYIYRADNAGNFSSRYFGLP